MIIAVLSRTEGMPPIVVVAENEAAARRGAAEEILARLNEIEDIDPAWVDAFPLSTLLDDDAVITQWLAEFKEQTTDLWLYLYDAGSPGETEQSFTDLRAPSIARFTQSVRDAYLTVNGGNSDTEVESLQEAAETAAGLLGVDFAAVRDQAIADAADPDD